jgi:hypothetical protein
MKAKFNRNCVHVLSIGAFVNHFQEVDPELKEMTITFDRPVVPESYSINYGSDGKDHYPIVGRPEFFDHNKSIRLRLQLKPGWHYSFVLTGLTFRAPDGFPLAPYSVDFQTRY